MTLEEKKLQSMIRQLRDCYKEVIDALDEELEAEGVGEYEQGRLDGLHAAKQLVEYIFSKEKK